MVCCAWLRIKQGTKIDLLNEKPQDDMRQMTHGTSK
jgi:hypothetical protein